ncbi:hypothetical protein [Marinibactrum halimedae]|uniref:Uncharacterized protein n=1 Tax=Marinibactrum halimedae TaxID=1444977 RepID=A0AA37T909_9GAMM|nr:hypothetical protein [Marinibactrum halimedae]MCD9458911.1 hypothetical protein [Marinibactrum halimedae]GLS27759.1 hypothetical protein GCM10007877_34780 [Marinibactrum halimedae]
MTSEDFARGFAKLEQIIKQKTLDGEDAYPPSYAQFESHCAVPPQARGHREFTPLALPSDEAIKKSKDANNRFQQDFKNIFGDL